MTKRSSNHNLDTEGTAPGINSGLRYQQTQRGRRSSGKAGAVATASRYLFATREPPIGTGW